ncbi:hypothetical protein KKA24_03570 [Patescibacteria group bacterium]|nr:hypothetical protein [Patescibacteria group bacterium]
MFKTRKVTFPHMGNYFYAFKPIISLLGDEIIMPPPITKRTIELGCKHSPESACIPFKYNLGNYIEALDLGANVLVQAGGGCRFGYYGEVQEEILKKLGYEFQFIKLSNDYFSAIMEILALKKTRPGLTYLKIIKSLILFYKRLRAIDKIEAIVRRNIGFEINEGEFKGIHKRFLLDLDKTISTKNVKEVEKEYKKRLEDVKIKKPENLIRVALIGELYVLMEPFSNFYIEKELAKKGIEVHRFVTVSSILHDSFSFKTYITKFLKQARPYLKYHIGAHGTESVGIAHKLIKQGFDGVIHIKPFGCMPEVNAMSALHKMSKDYKTPIIYFSFDSQTSETGIKTRIEAFYDMLQMKTNKK